MRYSVLLQSCLNIFVYSLDSPRRLQHCSSRHHSTCPTHVSRVQRTCACTAAIPDTRQPTTIIHDDQWTDLCGQAHRTRYSLRSVVLVTHPSASLLSMHRSHPKFSVDLGLFLLFVCVVDLTATSSKGCKTCQARIAAHQQVSRAVCATLTLTLTSLGLHTAPSSPARTRISTVDQY